METYLIIFEDMKLIYLINVLMLVIFKLKSGKRNLQIIDFIIVQDN